MLVVPQISYDYNTNVIACTAANRVGRTRKEMVLTVQCEICVCVYVCASVCMCVPVCCFVPVCEFVCVCV